jgi:DNA mismatch repair protein MutS
LFGSGAPPEEVDPPSETIDPLREALEGIDPDTLTPRQALDALYRLRGLA